jgi:hypothetical protein
MNAKIVFLFLVIPGFVSSEAGELKVIQDHIERIGLDKKKIIEFGFRHGELAFKLAEKYPLSTIFCFCEENQVMGYWENKSLPLNLKSTHSKSEGVYDIVVDVGSLNNTSHLFKKQAIKTDKNLLGEKGDLFLCIAPNQFKANDFDVFYNLLKEDKDFCMSFLVLDLFKCNPQEFMEFLKTSDLKCISMNAYEGSYECNYSDLEKLLRSWLLDIPKICISNNKNPHKFLLERYEDQMKKLFLSRFPNKDFFSYSCPMLFAWARKSD